MQNIDTCTNVGDSKCILVHDRVQIPKGACLYNSLYVTFWRRENCGVRKKSAFPVIGRGRERVASKGQ